MSFSLSRTVKSSRSFSLVNGRGEETTVLAGFLVVSGVDCLLSSDVVDTIGSLGSRYVALMSPIPAKKKSVVMEVDQEKSDGN